MEPIGVDTLYTRPRCGGCCGCCTCTGGDGGGGGIFVAFGDARGGGVCRLGDLGATEVTPVGVVPAAVVDSDGTGRNGAVVLAKFSNMCRKFSFTA